MALSAYGKQRLDNAIEQANKEGQIIFGFVVNGDQSDIQPFGNGTETIIDFIHNLKEGVALLEEMYLSEKQEA